MKILILDAYFYPEKIAFSHLEKDLIECFVAKGHEVTVVCPVPTRSVDKTYGFRYKRGNIETVYGARIVRFYAPQEGKNPIVRALRYFWCNVREGQMAKKFKDADAVFCVSTPPTQGIVAGRAAKKLCCPFVYSLQDVFPDSLLTTGLAKKDGPLWKIGSIIERKTYEYADKIIVIGNEMKKNILKKGVPEEKIEVVTNWIDVNSVKPVEKKENKLFDEFKLDRDKFTVVYAGNLGEAQGADVILDAAKELIDDENIQFVIFGGGAKYESIKSRIERENIKNIFITGLLPQQRVSEVYSMGSVALITCKKGTGNAGMPSKTWSIMACGTPIIASFDCGSELADILEKSKAGVCVEPESPAELAKAIKTASEKENRGDKTYIREYVVKNASKEICTKRYMDLLEQLGETGAV